MNTLLNRIWGEASAVLSRGRRFSWADVLVIFAIAGAIYGLMHTAQAWSGVQRESIHIDLSPWALPKYVLYSLTRGLAAFALSLVFSLVYGYWAAKDKLAERALVPLLDILQSIPVLGYFPPLLLTLVSAFPHSDMGLEVALEVTAVLLIFTSQAWNMTFSFYYSLKNVPSDMREVATVYRFSWMQRLRQVEIPFATIGLVWNSMMSMAGGWFFLTVSESFRLHNQDFRLPGVGSYMAIASERGDKAAQAWAIVAMISMIVALDQLLWRPAVVWSQKFRVEEGGDAEEMSSWALDFLRRSQLLRWVLTRLRERVRRQDVAKATVPTETPLPPSASQRAMAFAPMALLILLCPLLLFGVVKLGLLIKGVPAGDWSKILGGAGVTLGRVLVATALGTLWTVPVGLAIGLSAKLSKILQPVVQVVASFPAPMLYPALVPVFTAIGLPWGIGSVLLMLLGTQWYILFNVIAGATAIPADLREAARSYRIIGTQRFWVLYFPALFPYLVTGWVTAAGGAWNASVVSERFEFNHQVISTYGLGSLVTEATANSQFAVLAASVVVMSAVVVLFNRIVWRRLHVLAETRFSLTK